MRFNLNGWQLNKVGGEPGRCDVIAPYVTAQPAYEIKLRKAPANDALTGLANYRGLSETVDSEIKRSKRSGQDFAVLVFDLNGMKQINERHGHLAGNRALCRLAHIVRFSCRSIDTAARYGGDEFAIILPMSGAEAADIVERRICERLSTNREEPLLSVSAGYAVYPEDGKTLDTLFQVANRALYKMKEQRNRHPAPSRISPFVDSTKGLLFTLRSIPRLMRKSGE
jgi:diguanylate cyclase (GGDEF)-like protein